MGHLYLTEVDEQQLGSRCGSIAWVEKKVKQRITENRS